MIPFRRAMLLSCPPDLLRLLANRPYRRHPDPVTDYAPASAWLRLNLASLVLFDPAFERERSVVLQEYEMVITPAGCRCLKTVRFLRRRCPGIMGPIPRGQQQAVVAMIFDPPPPPPPEQIIGEFVDLLQAGLDEMLSGD